MKGALRCARRTLELHLLAGCGARRALRSAWDLTTTPCAGVNPARAASWRATLVSAARRLRLPSDVAALATRTRSARKRLVSRLLRLDADHGLVAPTVHEPRDRDDQQPGAEPGLGCRQIQR